MAAFPTSRWNAEVDRLAVAYRSAEPFPHAVIEGFLDRETLARAVREFPDPASADWKQYRHVNSKKLGLTKRELFPPTIRAVIDELNSQPFVDFLERLTGIKGLLIDETLQGGGMHQSEPGGFLNVHADFTVHPEHLNWRRRLNVLVYLNENWRDEYAGHLELWDPEMRQCVRKVAPVFNRCVVFNTDEKSFHGHPEPLQCPPGMTRKSLALYYYTAESVPLRVRTTDYQARPSDGFGRRVKIRLGAMALQGYKGLSYVAHGIISLFSSSS
jgi:hypothetical protein